MLDPVDVDIADSDFLENQCDGYESSDSEIDNYCMAFTCKNRLFGRQKPLHVVLGGGLCADIILWRNKQISVYVCMGVSTIWLLFEKLGYHLLTFVCHATIFFMVTLFLWSNLASYINIFLRTASDIPEITVPKDLFVTIAVCLTSAYNCALGTFGNVAFGKDYSAFLSAVAVLWVLSIVGRWYSFLSFLYGAFWILMTVPLLYECLEDTVDGFAEKALIEIKKQYAVLDEMVIQNLKKKASSYKNIKQQ
ncbi:reticulon-like protein B4 [Argentina anserina]|uniref:reticulon-like protein B4 n=1 Tax=Argentina anserina TaxID=57926 RepID=UPI0021766C0C|nr:reticulon-like protein B4 [Potentilla anserina]